MQEDDKHLISIVAMITLLFSTTICLAQVRNDRLLHSPSAGDNITKQLVDYTSCEQTGQNLTWDISSIEEVDEAYKTSYFETDSTHVGVTALENGSLLRYVQADDTLMLQGFESPTTCVKYDHPEPLLKEPLTFGDTMSGYIHGYGIDSEHIYMRQYGVYRVSVDATGTLLLPSGDTLRHVTRVHSEKLLTENQYPFIHTEDGLKQYVDSIVSFNDDSIVSGLTHAPVLVYIEHNRWYAEGYRYPVYETVRKDVLGDNEQYVTAFYNPPEDQERLNDLDNEELRKELARMDREQQMNAGTERHNTPSGCCSDDDNWSNSPLFTYCLHESGDHVTIDYCNSSIADITCGIYTSMGIVISEQHEIACEAGGHQVCFDISGQHPNTYMLVIKVNDKTYTEKIHKH